MSVSAANQHLEKVRMELDNKTFQTYSLDQNLEKQALKLTEISSRYEHDKQVWCGAISNLEQKVKVTNILPLKGGATPKFSQRTQLVTENYQVV
nr:kinesin-like protein KIN-14R [Ipomoea batatas]